MKQRNPKATCETCPYWFEENTRMGTCRKHMPSVPVSLGSNNRRYDSRAITINGVFSDMFSDDWCGEHPDFFLKPPVGAMGVYDPSKETMEEAKARLINEAENALASREWDKWREELKQ